MTPQVTRYTIHHQQESYKGKFMKTKNEKMFTEYLKKIIHQAYNSKTEKEIEGDKKAKVYAKIADAGTKAAEDYTKWKDVQDQITKLKQKKNESVIFEEETEFKLINLNDEDLKKINMLYEIRMHLDSVVKEYQN